MVKNKAKVHIVRGWAWACGACGWCSDHLVGAAFQRLLGGLLSLSQQKLSSPNSLRFRSHLQHFLRIPLFLQHSLTVMNQLLGITQLPAIILTIIIFFAVTGTSPLVEHAQAQAGRGVGLKSHQTGVPSAGRGGAAPLLPGVDGSGLESAKDLADGANLDAMAVDSQILGGFGQEVQGLGYDNLGGFQADGSSGGLAAGNRMGKGGTAAKRSAGTQLYRRNQGNKKSGFNPILLPVADEGNNDSGFTDALVDEGVGPGDHAFFERGAATAFFQGDAQLQGPAKVQILNAARKSGADAEEEASVSKQLAEARASLQREDRGVDQEKTPSAAQSEVPASAEDVVEKFGNPDQEPRIEAEKSAPDSYKGLLAALEMGDDELAYRYARQYVRYQRNLNERVKKLTELSQIALEKEGLVPEGANSEDPNYEISKTIAEKIEGFNKAADQSSETRRVKLDEQTQQLLRLAQGDEEKDIFSDEKEAAAALAGAASAQAAGGTAQKLLRKPPTRDEIRAELASKLRPDPKGKVIVQYFFRPNDSTHADMMKRLTEIAWQYRDVPKVGFVAFSIDRMAKLELDELSSGSGLAPIVPMRSGADLAQRLAIKRGPAVVIVAATSGEAHILQGKQDQLYLEEFIKVIRGGDK